MSHEATEYVWKHSPYKGTALIIHLAIAEVVNELHQWRYWGGDAAIAERARCERTTVHRWKHQAMADGYLVEHGTDPETRHKQYLFLMPGGVLQNATPGTEPEAEVVLQNATSDVAKTATDVASATTAPITNRRTEGNQSASLVASTTTFDEFWEVYPRKAGKVAARKAWMKSVRNVNPQIIVAGAVRFRDDPNRVDQFTPHPATWLNQGRWDDEPLPPRVAGGGGGPSDDSGWDALKRMAGQTALVSS